MFVSSETKELIHRYCAGRREELDIMREDWFYSYVADTKIVTSLIDDIIENQICSQRLKQEYSDPDDKFFCQLTACQKCRKCTFATMKSFRQYVVEKNRSLRDEHEFARSIIYLGGKKCFNNDLHAMLERVKAYKSSVELVGHFVN